MAADTGVSETNRVVSLATHTMARRMKTMVQVSPKAPATFWSSGRKLHTRLRLLKLSELPTKVCALVRRRLWQVTEFRLYSMDMPSVTTLPNPGLMKRDCLADLLLFVPSEGWQLDFLQNSMEWIERGAHPYTHIKQGRLVHYGWMIEEEQHARLADVGQEWIPPAGAVVLANFYTDPGERGKGLYYSSLCQMLHDAQRASGARAVFIGVLADNVPSRKVIEKVGFSYQYSFFQKRRLWWASRWSTIEHAPTTRP
jgi:RimJ/RimL family protein N-acetyltransferase